jgi:hypothetical protein
MHRHMLQSAEVKRDIAFDWDEYWNKGEGADHILMFSVDNRMTNVDSDSLYNLMFVSSWVTGRDEIKERVDLLLKKDFNWLKKYFLNPTEVKNYVKTLRKSLGK